MWNCRVTGDDVSEYGAYTFVFDNLLGFVIGYEHSAASYLDLIEENRAIFLDCSSPETQYYHVVEPRELLFLMNHVDTADRLYWAPRPYRRCGDITKEYLFHCPENDTIACIFCGFKEKRPADTSRAPVEGGVTRSSVFAAGTPLNNEAGLLDELQNSIIRAARDAFERETRGAMSSAEERYGGVDETDYVPPDALPPPPVEPDSQPPPAPVRPDTNANRRRTHSTKYHFDKCPLLWLERNCTWRTKYSTYQIHEPSKFGTALQLLQRSRGRRFMSTEMEWNEFVQLTSNTTVMGACEATVVSCYKKLIEMKLDSVDRYHGDGREFRRLPLYTVYYDASAEQEAKSRQPFCRPLACVLEHSSLYGSTYRTDRRNAPVSEPNSFGEPTFTALREEEMVDRINGERVVEERNETNESRNYLSHVLRSKRAGETRPPPNGRVFYSIDMETAWKAFVMHGFCVQRRSSDTRGDDVYDVEATDDDGGYTIRHKFSVPPTDMLCIYCGYSFGSRLGDPDLVDSLYEKDEKTSIAKYLLGRSQREDVLLCTTTTWWNRNAGPNRHLALAPSDVVPAEPQKDGTEFTNNEKMALWLSASLNNSHSSKCVLRKKKRVWNSETCPVCLTEDTRHARTMFNCGHVLCKTCVRDVRLTNCPLCKQGTRKRRISICTVK